MKHTYKTDCEAQGKDMPAGKAGQMGTRGAPQVFLRYTLVGIGSTVIQYAVYSICYGFSSNYVFANVMGFLVSVWNSYFWNRRFVFHSAGSTVWWKVLLKSYAIYFGTGVAATNLLSYLFIRKLGISPYLSPLLIVLVLYPINYQVNKRWAHMEEVSS